MIFFGPNNSGKSLVSRFIHSLTSHDLPKFPSKRPFVRMSKISKEEWYDAFGFYMLEYSGIKYDAAVTFRKNKCIIEAKTNQKCIKFEFSNNLKNYHHKVNTWMLFDRSYRYDLPKSKNRNSVYIPAARTGTLQFFTIITQMRSRLLSEILHTLGDTKHFSTEKTSDKDIRRFLRSLGQFPAYLEEFYDLILEAQTQGLDGEIRDLIKSMYGGDLTLYPSRGLPIIHYTDPMGFSTEIERAGSGVISSFPILLGANKVATKGTLIVEEPEAHIEPSKQLILIEDLCRISISRGNTLLLTTHSDYIIKKILAMISQGKLKNQDVSLFFFEKPKDKFTTIKKIKIDKEGIAEQPNFQDALDSLISDFSK